MRVHKIPYNIMPHGSLTHVRQGLQKTVSTGEAFAGNNLMLPYPFLYH